jgi:hypothetical protein
MFRWGGRILDAVLKLEHAPPHGRTLDRSPHHPSSRDSKYFELFAR